MDAKSFFDKVSRMRKAQKEYFRTKSGRALNESTHKILTLKRRKKVECIEFEGVYYPVSDGGWWTGFDALVEELKRTKK